MMSMRYCISKIQTIFVSLTLANVIEVRIGFKLSKSGFIERIYIKDHNVISKTCLKMKYKGDGSDVFC